MRILTLIVVLLFLAAGTWLFRGNDFIFGLFALAMAASITGAGLAWRSNSAEARQSTQ